MEDNQSTWLTETDMVFIDPLGPDSRVRRDPNRCQILRCNVTSSLSVTLSNVLVETSDGCPRCFSRRKLWNNPCGRLIQSLYQSGNRPHGIVLISTVLNFQTSVLRIIRPSARASIPSFATTPGITSAFPPALQGRSVEQIAQEARVVATNEYMPANDEDRHSHPTIESCQQFSALTGLSSDFVQRITFGSNLMSSTKSS